MEWRAAMGRFATGVTIVTSWDGQEPVGTTVNAFCSVSLEPPLLLICLGHGNPVLGPIEAAGIFCVNILASECVDLAWRFGRDPSGGRFDAVEHHSDGGAPRLAVATAFIDCRVEQTHDAGDHRIVVGRGLRVSDHREAPPLVFHRGQFPKLEQG
jgi:3-hydroxy-9,10-secoandrosta-1,3,5(10)-triene-9,17-dione monooxygenase reductase component